MFIVPIMGRKVRRMDGGGGGGGGGLPGIPPPNPGGPSPNLQPDLSYPDNTFLPGVPPPNPGIRSQAPSRTSPPSSQ